MVSRITAALAARYKAIQEKEKGFTLIELLVVVIIIGVLAAIAIPVYMGVQNNAKDSSVQSDVTNAKIAIVSAQTNDGKLPGSSNDIGTVVDEKDGLTEGDALAGTMTYKADVANNTFCIAAKSVTDSVFYVTEAAGVTKVEGSNTLPSTCTAPGSATP